MSLICRICKDLEGARVIKESSWARFVYGPKPVLQSYHRLVAGCVQGTFGDFTGFYNGFQQSFTCVVYVRVFFYAGRSWV